MNDEKTGGVTPSGDPDAARLSALLADSSGVPADCSDGELLAVDFRRCDALVGTVRSDEQFLYCLENRVYYVPARVVEASDLPVAVIALYEEGLSRKPGIKRYGEVTETRVVKRGDIPVTMSRDNPEETYYLFAVAAWRYLDTPIALEGTSRGKPLLTNRFLLTHCRRSYQLVAIRSPERYRLSVLLSTLAETVEEEAPRFRRVGERHLLSVADGQLRLLDAAGGCLFACPAAALRTRPGEVLDGVARGLGI